MSWLDALFAGRTPPRAIDAERITERIRVQPPNKPNDHEERAVELLDKADGMAYSNSFERATTIAVIGVGYAVLAVAREIRGLKQ